MTAAGVLNNRFQLCRMRSSAASSIQTVSGRETNVVAIVFAVAVSVSRVFVRIKRRIIRSGFTHLSVPRFRLFFRSWGTIVVRSSCAKGAEDT
jgi:hypothetical protein